MIIQPLEECSKIKGRQDVRRYDFQENACLLVFWKVLKIGKGTTVSLYVYDKEVLKFDCFGENDGHYHVLALEDRQRRSLFFRKQKQLREQRIYFRETTPEAQVDRAIFEFRRNLNWYLQWHQDPRVSSFEPDLERFNPALDAARAQMLEFEHSVPELQR